MRIKTAASILCLLSLSVASVAVADTVNFRFHRYDGQLITDAPVGVMDENGTLLMKLAPEASGLYSADLVVGQKYHFSVNDASIPKLERGTGGIATTTAVMEMTVGVDPNPPQGVPANDDCANAEAVAVPSNTFFSTIAATGGSSEAPNCGTSVTGPGIWYSLIGTGGQIRVDTCNTSGFDTKLTVVCLGCDDQVCVGANDDGPGCSGFTSDLQFPSEAGTEYLVFVHGFGGATGTGTLNVSDVGANVGTPVNCTPPPPVGACCSCLSANFNCTEGTEDDCLSRTNDPNAFQGDDTTCLIISGQAQEFSPNTPLQIPDGLGANVPGPTLTDTFTMVGSGTIADVNVESTILHTWIGDLVIEVSHDGTTVGLWDRTCDAFGQFIDLLSTWDDEGTAQFCTSPCCAGADGVTVENLFPQGGNGILADFDGGECSGDWSLSITDWFGADTGTLVEWGITCTQGTPLCPDTSGGGGSCDVPGLICHCPPGNGGNCQTLLVSTSAVAAHLGHPNDHEGACTGNEGGGTDQFRTLCTDLGQDHNSILDFAPVVSDNDSMTTGDDDVAPRGLRGRTDRRSSVGRR